MSRRAAVLLGAMCLAGPAQAALTPADLLGVGVEPRTGAQAPLTLTWRDEAGRPITLREALAGRPGVLVFADYTCRTLCGPALVLTGAALEQTGLRPGADYRLVALGLDPKDGPAEARAMRRTRLAGFPRVGPVSILLSGDAETVSRATGALGYRAVYDPEHDQFAHDAALYVLRPDGGVQQVLSEVALDPGQLRQALTDARTARRPGVIARLRALCYGFDPAHGRYNGAVGAVVRTGAIATMLLIGGWLALSLRRRRTA